MKPAVRSWQYYANRRIIVWTLAMLALLAWRHVATLVGY